MPTKSFEIRITPKEKSILLLICEGFTTKDIADKLEINHRTVETHKSKLIFKTGANNTPQLVAIAFRNKVIS